MTSLLAVILFSDNWNVLPCNLCYKRWRERNRMVRDQMSMEGVTEGQPVALSISLGQAKIDVQGRCILAAPKLMILRQNFWQNFKLGHCSNYDILEILCTNSTALQTVATALLTLYPCNYLLLEREKNWRHNPVTQHLLYRVCLNTRTVTVLNR